jgi:hypothetical protein
MLLNPTTELRLQHEGEHLRSLRPHAPTQFLADEEIGALRLIAYRLLLQSRRLSSVVIGGGGGADRFAPRSSLLVPA